MKTDTEAPAVHRTDNVTGGKDVYKFWNFYRHIYVKQNKNKQFLNSFKTKNSWILWTAFMLLYSNLSQTLDSEKSEMIQISTKTDFSVGKCK